MHIKGTSPIFEYIYKPSKMSPSAELVFDLNEVKKYITNASCQKSLCYGKKKQYNFPLLLEGLFAL